MKPNLLMPRLPDQAVTTHPAVVAAVGRELAAGGCELVLGDSPGGPFTRALLERLYARTGMDRAAADCGAELAYDTAAVEVQATNLPHPRSFTLCRSVDQADLLINLCKLKTHGLTGITAAAKNLFGCIPGMLKTEYHMTQPTVEAFSDVLVDLARFLAPALSVCDAIVAMEGAGPSHGKPRRLGLLLAAADPFALDYALAKLLGVGPDEFTTLAAAARRGYGPQSDDQFEVVMADPQTGPRTARGPAAAGLLRGLAPAGFELLQPEQLVGLHGRGVLQAVLRRVQPFLRSRPAFSPATCNGCGTCVRSCPADALEMAGRLPRLNLKICIRCYCCQELCPQGAVTIVRPAFSRLIYRRGAKKRR